MSKKYLDDTGLAYFWGKIKALFLKGNAGGVFYGTCSTAAATTAKVVVCDAFTSDELVAGATVWVKFSDTNSGAVGSLTLNVNNTGAKNIKYINNGSRGNLTSAGYLKAGPVYPFTYDGTYWVCAFNYNTTYSSMTDAEYQAGTSTSSRLITPARLKAAILYHAPVQSVNGQTGAVTLTIPSATSQLTNDSDFLVASVIDDYLTPKVYAADATTQAVIAQVTGGTPEIRTPSSFSSLLMLMLSLNPRVMIAWMNGTELEMSRIGVSINTSNNVVILYLRGRTSIATGVMGVDSSWTVASNPPAVEIERW